MNNIDTISHHRFPAADGIRGLAVLIVLVVHSMVMFFPKTYDGLAGSGKIGVWLFFVLSAFLLTNTFIQKGFGVQNITSYIIGRFIRIMPLYILTLIIYCAFGYFSLQEAYSIFKLNNPWGHLWTIAVEFKFYFLLPFICFILIRIQSRFGNSSMIAAAIIIIAIQQWNYPYFEVKPSSTDMTGYISAFMPGICAAILLPGQSSKKNTLPDLICVLVLIGILLSVPQIRKVFFGIPNDGYLLDKHVHFAFAWSVLVFFTLSSTGRLNSLFCSRWLRQLGKWSFSIYLFHWLIYTQITKFFIESYLWATIAFSLAIIIGGIIFYLVEKPLEKWRHFTMRKA